MTQIDTTIELEIPLLNLYSLCLEESIWSSNDTHILKRYIWNLLTTITLDEVISIFEETHEKSKRSGDL